MRREVVYERRWTFIHVSTDAFMSAAAALKLEAAPLIWSFTAHLIKCSQPIRWDVITVWIKVREIAREWSVSGRFAFSFSFIYFYFHLFCSSDFLNKHETTSKECFSFCWYHQYFRLIIIIIISLFSNTFIYFLQNHIMKLYSIQGTSITFI